MLKELFEELGAGFTALWLGAVLLGVALNVVIIWAIIKAVLYFT